MVKEGIFERINRDRLLAGLLPVGWDEAASRVADTFCAQQVREATRGHFLMDGVPPSPEARRARVLPPRPALRGQDAFAPEAVEFVTIVREPPPAPLTREEATGRTSYTFVFYTMVRASEPARAGASATIWVE